MKMTKAFTMIELIFVIIILGILSAVALPRFQGIRDQADIATGRAQVATIRTALANDRQSRLILGCADYAETGAGTSTCANGTVHNDINRGGLFGGVLQTPLTNSNAASNWNATAAQELAGVTFNYNVGGTNTVFTYEDTNGTLTCVAAANNCDDLVN